ncbi:LexA family transcriptional regulator [Niallia taxi]|uniref:LexA family protein n=1 Tax=Niallia taxi TaxID=2499688 RepID=UPI00316EA618
MEYSKLIDEYIKKSGMSLAEIAEKMKNEKGVKVDRTYISKLRKDPKYAASKEINHALAEVTGGDPHKLVWAGLVFGSHPSVREVLMLIDDEIIIKAINLMEKYPGYFNMSEEEQEKYNENHDVVQFWNDLAKSMGKARKEHLRTQIERAYEEHGIKDDQEDDDQPYVNESVSEYNPNSMISIPVLGCVQAGIPIEMIENPEGYTLVDPYILNGKDGFALRVQGDSMIGDRIHDGDLVIVSKQEEVQPHEIAVVAVNGDHATLKRVRLHGNMAMLIPSNPAMEPQLVPAEDIHILGKVVEVKFRP